MKNRWKTLLGAVGMLAVIAGFLFGATVSADEPTWNIGPRILPAPSAVSETLRVSIEKTPQPDVAAHIQATTFETRKQWTAFIQAMNAKKEPLIEALIEGYKVTIKKDTVAGVTVRTVTPAVVAPSHRDRLFLHIHGGAYVLNAGRAGVVEAILIAHRARIKVLSIDYRMPPEHPFPAAIDDVVAVYRRLLKDRPARSMAMGGSSAGGGLALAAIHKLIELKLAIPGALFAGTPWSDLTGTGDSYITNEGIDRILVTNNGALAGAARLYAGSHDMRSPLISPVYGDFKGFPPTYLVTGTRDLFLSNTVRTHRKLKTAGVVADLNVYEGMSHGEYGFVMDAPESHQAYGELGAFLVKYLE